MLTMNGHRTVAPKLWFAKWLMGKKKSVMAVFCVPPLFQGNFIEA
jgi:hypothetical protein